MNTAPTSKLSAASGTVLLIDDAPEIHALFKVHLRALSLTLLHAYSGHEGLTMAEAHRPNLILLDFQMPDMDGMAVLRALKEDTHLQSIPVMLVTGADDPETVTRAFALGATDYVRKPVCAAEVKARVSGELRTQLLMSQLRQQAYHDTLTGLVNRAYLAERVGEAIERHQQTPDRHFAVLFFDFDRFKDVNDSLGHTVGDLLLTMIAARLTRDLRVSDAVMHASEDSTIARIGGDEFVVLLNGLRHPDDAAVVADRLLKGLSESYRLGDHEVFSTASVGVVPSGLGHRTVDSLLRDADIAMYEAKAAGKGRYVVFNRAMRTRAQRRLAIQNDLHRAIEQRQFFLLYQPIVSLATGRLESVEALIRWRHPERGTVAPDQFIPTAEEMGLIVPIGEWVLREACRQFAEWRTGMGARAPASISVNLARQQLLVPDFADQVADILRHHGMGRSDLHLEVTESEMMRDVAATTRMLSLLRELGVLIDMDDFGTGHSSLACLRDFPLDVLKIDRSFVSTVGAGRDLMAVLNAIIELAHDLGMKTVAEGIETADQLATLQALNCDYGQGYYLARPLPAHEVTAFVAPGHRRNRSGMPAGVTRAAVAGLQVADGIHGKPS